MKRRTVGYQPSGYLQSEKINAALVLLEGNGAHVMLVLHCLCSQQA
jgi:hypothetical protein